MLFVLCALSAVPHAQPAKSPSDGIETIIVTASKFHTTSIAPGAVAHDFVRFFATPTVLRNAIARWQVPICPNFEGGFPEDAAVMEARFRAIAGEAGAHLKDKGCKPNLVVAITPDPQAYLDMAHAVNSGVLGYHGTPIVSHPIQAWFVTGVTDIRGQQYPDADREATVECKVAFCGLSSTSTAPQTNVGGFRFRPDETSDIIYATIIVDTDKTASYPVGGLADYIAMLALSRSEDYGDCQLMPSITNFLSSNCDDKLRASAITPSDLAYLRGVYKMDPGATLAIQQDEIAGEMAKSLEAGK